jgi:molybdopterin-containing oxidoreductase family iron-sulfur binding subunit
MNISRKDFLRILTGSAVMAGVGSLVTAAVEEQPLTNVAVGDKRRWGMVIDIRKCREEKGCDACIRACNSVHNIPQIPNKDHEVKWIWNEKSDCVFPHQPSEYASHSVAATLLVLCNHCTQPACTLVCPTKATWKREDGVVMMDYHRCIGCRYCMAACPYGSRSFNFENPRPYLTSVDPGYPTRTVGVVEKCNFCEERLAAGKLPACVEACAGKALLFGDLNDEQSAVRQVLRERFSIQRRPELGSGPSIFYLV